VSDPPAPGGCVGPLPLSEILRKDLEPFNRCLKVAHINAQSIFCHIDEFRTIFQSNSCGIILVSETWLKPYLSDKSVELPGYELFRNDRLHKRGGGVAAYVKSDFCTRIIHSSDNSRPNRSEYLFLDVCFNSTHVLICVCYRPPNTGYLAEFEQVLLDQMVRYSHVIVMGDFNTDLLGPATYNQTYLTNMFHSCDMTVLPLQATHHTATADTWLDIMTVTDPAHVAHHGQFPAPGLSNHDLVYCAYRLLPPKSKPTFVSYRDYKNINYEALLNDARGAPWDEVARAVTVDDKVNAFTDIMNKLQDKHAPLITKRVTRNPAPWINDEIRQMQRQRDTAFRRSKRTKTQEDWVTYKTLRNRTQQLIRNAKAKWFCTSLSKKQSTKSLWNKVKELGIGKSHTASPIHLELNDINNYFVNIPIDHTGARDYLQELSAAPHVPPRRQFSFTPVTEAGVRWAIMRTTSNAVGTDKIPIRLIKETLPVTLPIITSIFNASLSSGIFPSTWKSAIVRPLQKTPSPKSPSDYRPISILPALSKCLERLVHQQMYSYIIRYNILSNFQSGFRSQHSTTTALLKITDDIRRAMDKKLLTFLMLFDFSKAFDCVYHPLLLFKLKKAGFSPGCVGWVESYLTDRRQCVQHGHLTSDWCVVTRGVPQGSVLGPLLFSLYIDDVTKVIKTSLFHLYADDLQIYRHFYFSELNSTVASMNAEIEDISSWAYSHGLQLNETKTQVMLLGTCRLLNTFDCNAIPKLELNNKQLLYCDHVKNLGVTINKTLDWSAQVKATCNRVFAGIHSLKRFGHCLPQEVKVMLVKTLVFPHFNYCDVVYNDMTVQLSDKLQRAQNYCVRFIYNLRRDDHVTPYLNQLSILKLNLLRKYHILRILYNVLGSLTPIYLYEQFTFLSEISERTSRHSALTLVVPAHSTVKFTKSFTVTACQLWNSLPAGIRSIKKRARFGAEVRAWLLEAPRGQ